METITTKVPFNAKEYARNYQRTRYNNDPVFKQKQQEHVKKLYETNRDLLITYKNELKLKEMSNNIV